MSGKRVGRSPATDRAAPGHQQTGVLIGDEKNMSLSSSSPPASWETVWAGQAWGGVRKGEGLHKHLLCLWVEFEE